jgi:xylan 1,4-beta-xylosidase
MDYANDYGFRYVRSHSCVHNPGIYSEDETGRPVYDFSEFDRRIDAVVELGMWPVICLEGVPPEIATEDAGKGWRNPYPPRGEEGYRRWQQICERLVAHCRERYGSDIHNWLFEVWNEPNAPGYFKGTLAEYLGIYDHAVEGATAADPEITIGGPGAAGTGWTRELLEHCAGGTNYATGETGTRIDFLSWHIYTVGVGVPSFAKLRQEAEEPHAALADFPQYADLPTIITEWGCSSASRPFHDRPYNAAFRVLGVQTLMDAGTTLALPFNYGSGPPHAHEGFQGNHALFTRTIVPKPQFRAFQLMDRMVGDRVACSSDGPPVGGVACLAEDGSALWVMLYNIIEDYRRDDYETAVTLAIDGFDLAGCAVRQWRIAPGECDPYLVWEQMGKPEELTAQQQQALLEASEIPPPDMLSPDDETINFEMPGSSAALIEIRRNTAR